MKKSISLLTYLLICFSLIAQETDKEKYEALIKSGTEKDIKEDFNGAIKDFSKAIKLDPTNPLAYDKRGVTYIKTYKYSKAIKDFNTAIEYDPKFISAYNHRGLTNYYINKSILALKDFDLTLELDPGYARAYFNRGLVKLEFGDVEGAYADFKHAGELDYDQAEDAIWKYCTDRLFVVPPSYEEYKNEYPDDKEIIKEDPE